MRILYFTRDYTPHDHRFLSALAQSEHEVFSLRLERRSRQLEDRPLPDVIEQIPWRGGRVPARWQDAPALLVGPAAGNARVKPDVIHAGPIQTAPFWQRWPVFDPWSACPGARICCRMRTQHRVCAGQPALPCAERTLLLGDCQAVQHKAAGFGFPAERMVLFPWGVDLQHFSARPGR